MIPGARPTKQKRVETLDIIPAKMQVIRHVREKGVCPSCDGSFKTAEMPKQPIPRSIASPALLAHITTCKYVDGLPLYRQEEILRRIGVDIPRATLANWMIKLSELVKPLINLIRERIIESPVITMDETHVQVLKEKGKKASSRSFMWVMVGHDSGKKAVIFEYSSSRKSEVALRMLQEFEGTLVSDGYSAYPFVARVLGLRHAGCWDHARRKFIEAAKGIKGEQGLAVEALNLINALYRVERNYKDEGVEQLHRARSIYSWSILRHLRKWLDRHLPDITPRSQTGKAMHYLANEWERLVVFLEDGCIPVSNQAAENAVRPFVIGRKAWLFSASTKGAEASASLYSLVETAKANGIEPFSYLKKIFTELPAAETIEDIEKLLPWHK
ncbi:MAG: IS66 family transposase [Gammaproteobacteria bacterium]